MFKKSRQLCPVPVSKISSPAARCIDLKNDKGSAEWGPHPWNTQWNALPARISIPELHEPYCNLLYKVANLSSNVLYHNRMPFRADHTSACFPLCRTLGRA